MKEVFDFVLAFATVVGSSVNELTKSVQVSTSGASAFNVGGNERSIDLGDNEGELSDNQDMYGQLGILARPLDPEKIGGKDYRAEVVAARTADGLVPLAWRDLRLERFFPNGIPKGSVRMVGYGGAFASFDLADTENSYTIYIPYDFSGDTPTKAHAIIVDPNPDNGITLTHGDGYQVSLTSDSETFFKMKEGVITLSAAKIYAKGVLYVGQAGELGIPLLAGPASPPCPSLFLSPS
jgi:hypothetical protein